MSTNEKEEMQMNEEKKAFIQEQIVPGRKSRMKKGLLTAAAMVFCGILFGTAASLAFSITGTYFDKIFGREQEKEKISLEEEGQASLIRREEERKRAEELRRREEQRREAEQKSEESAEEEGLALDQIEEAYALLRNTAREYNASIVTVSGVVTGVDWFDNPSEMAEASYGVIVAEDEESLYILTYHDKIQAVERIQAAFADGSVIEADLCGKDKVTNLAVLAVEKEGLSQETLEGVLVAKLGDSYSLAEGTFVMALGSPNGYMYSIDYGIISGQKRDQPITDGKLELLHTNMAYNSNGGGIVVGLDGKVLGVITHDFDQSLDSEVFTMVGISRLKPVIEKLVNRQKQAYFGIIANDIPEEYKEKLAVPHGIYITEVENGSPALDAGLRAGDVIVEANGSMVASVITFYNILSQCQPKEELEVKIARTSSGGEAEKEITVLLGKR